MKIDVEQREPGHVPLGAILMLPLFLMPLGGWWVQEGQAHFGTCSLKATLGLPCMTCGATRGTMRLLYGDIGGAFLYQPMIMIVYLAIAAWGLTSFVSFIQDKRVRLRLTDKQNLAFKISLLAVPLLNWAYLIVVGV